MLFASTHDAMLMFPIRPSCCFSDVPLFMFYLVVWGVSLWVVLSSFGSFGICVIASLLNSSTASVSGRVIPAYLNSGRANKSQTGTDSNYTLHGLCASVFACYL